MSSILGSRKTWGQTKNMGTDGTYTNSNSHELVSVPPFPIFSRKRQTQIADRLVDLLRVLEADRDAIHSGVLESELHCLRAILMTISELAAPAQLHADHTQPFLFQLANVIDHFLHVVRVVGVLISRAVHAGA